MKPTISANRMLQQKDESVYLSQEGNIPEGLIGFPVNI